VSQLRERGVPARPLRLTEAAARPRSRPGKRAAGDGEKPVAPTLERAAVELALRSIHRVRAAVPWRRAALVALTGIDGSGKGHLASRILARLRRTDLRAVALGVDPWLNLPHVRFGGADPALHFYENALRQDEMFERLVLPLRDTRRCRLVADVAEETATTFRRQLFRFEDVDVVLLEGIFLLKPAYRELSDLSFWVDCSFETALERALTRRQEGLSPTATIRAYETIYFPPSSSTCGRTLRGPPPPGSSRTTPG